MPTKTDLFFLACVMKDLVPLKDLDLKNVENKELLFTPRTHRLIATNVVALNRLYESIRASVQSLDEGKSPVAEVDHKFCS